VDEDAYVATAIGSGTGMVGYEYLHRFGSNNHRGTLGGYWRVTRRATARAEVKAGSTTVVPNLEALAGATFDLSESLHLDVLGVYSHSPWLGAVVRSQASVAKDWGRFGTMVGGTAGALVQCGSQDLVYGVMARIGASLANSVSISGEYGFGNEVEIASFDPALLMGASCPAQVADPIIANLLRPRATLRHTFTSKLVWRARARLQLAFGYELDRWQHDARMDAGFIDMSLRW
jgi:hypothetical protein